MTDSIESRDDIKGLVDANVWNFYRLPEGQRSRIIDPLELLSPNRLDLMARIIYIRHKLLGHGQEWGTQVYHNLLRSWHKDCYVGDGRKNTFTDSLKHFDDLILDMQANGYQRSKGIIPHVGDTVVDGAHRLACCLYFKQPVEVVELEGDRQVQNAETLLRIGMDPAIVEQMMLEYLRLDPHTHVAFLFPVGNRERSRVEAILREESLIAYRKEISLPEGGQRNLIRLIYSHEDWWNPELLGRFVNDRFSTNAPMTVYFLKFPPGANVRAAKERVRAIFGIGNHPMHVNDTHEETCFIGEALLNRNSMHHLYSAEHNVFSAFRTNLAAFRDALAQSGLNRENVCIDSSAVLSAYGYRDARDIDYLTADGTSPLPDTEAYGLHNEEYRDFPLTPEQMMYNPKYHFYSDGFKFLSLDMTMLMKWRRGTEKDIKDCRLLLDAPRRILPVLYIPPPASSWRGRAIRLSNRVFVHGVTVLRLLLPAKHYTGLRQKFRKYRDGRA